MRKSTAPISNTTSRTPFSTPSTTRRRSRSCRGLISTHFPPSGVTTPPSSSWSNPALACQCASTRCRPTCLRQTWIPSSTLSSAASTSGIPSCLCLKWKASVPWPVEVCLMSTIWLPAPMLSWSWHWDAPVRSLVVWFTAKRQVHAGRRQASKVRGGPWPSYTLMAL